LLGTSRGKFSSEVSDLVCSLPYTAGKKLDGFVRSTLMAPSVPGNEGETQLKTKIEQMLTEARVMLPGGQALLGFQLVATLTKSFHELHSTYQYIHAARVQKG
jgi:hypothetical protein